VERPSELPWAQPGWRARAEAWIGAQVEPLGDVEEVKLRPWSAVLRAPTSGGDVYFKANLPALANEPELTRLLHRIDPGHVLPVLAEEPDEGWMLQADGGPTMRSRLDGGDDLGRWERMLGCYAELQVRASAHVEELLAAGAPDPPLEPPGTVSRSQGLCVGKKPEFSVEEPMANSSQLVLPTNTAPWLRSRLTAVPSYTGT